MEGDIYASSENKTEKKVAWKLDDNDWGRIKNIFSIKAAGPV